MGRADLGQRVGARHGHRVGLTALIEELLPLALPDAELLGKVRAVRVALPLTGIRSVRIAHGVPA